MKIPIDPLKLVPAVTALFRMWASSIRFEPHGQWDEVKRMHLDGVPLVIGLWHGELFPLTAYAYDMFDISVMISQSKDGEFITRVVERLGLNVVRGSSSRGGVRALLEAKRVMERDNSLSVFTLDGPRGPRHKAKDGAIFLAQRAKAKIIPVRAFPVYKKEFNSWDRFVVPMPFTHCPIYAGEPMEVTTDKLEKDVMDLEKRRLEKRMLELGPK